MDNKIDQFGGKRIDTGEWVYGNYIRKYFSKRGKSFLAYCIQVVNEITYEIREYEVDPFTVRGFTGVYDSTAWDDLTKEDKLLFYNRHNSDDGRTIKFNYPDDVQRLWKGRPIYEKDIIQYSNSIEFGIGVIEAVYGTSNLYIRWIKQKTSRPSVCDDISLFQCSSELKIIGNICDNPELLDAANQHEWIWFKNDEHFPKD